MKFSVEHSDLLAALTRLEKVVRANPTLQDGVQIFAEGDNVQLTATDTDIHLRLVLQATVVESATTIVSIRELLRILRPLPSGRINLHTGYYGLHCEESRLECASRAQEDFPPPPTLTAVQEITISVEALREMLRNRAFGLGVFLDLARNGDGQGAPYPSDNRRDAFIVPSKAVVHLNGLLPRAGHVQVLYNQTHASFAIVRERGGQSAVLITHVLRGFQLPVGQSEEALKDTLDTLFVCARARGLKPEDARDFASHTTIYLAMTYDPKRGIPFDRYAKLIANKRVYTWCAELDQRSRVVDIDCDDLEDTSSSNHSDNFSAEEKLDLIESCLACMSFSDALLIRRRYHYGESFDSICQSSRVPLSTTRVKLHRATKRLRYLVKSRLAHLQGVPFEGFDQRMEREAYGADHSKKHSISGEHPFPASVAIWILDELQNHGTRPQRLNAFFPELSAQLDEVMVSAGEDLSEIAARHALCAEALVQASHRLTRSATAPPLAEDLHTAFTADLCGLLRSFEQRPQEEQERILDAYPEVDLRLIQFALSQAALPDAFLPDVLTDSDQYDLLVHRLLTNACELSWPALHPKAYRAQLSDSVAYLTEQLRTPLSERTARLVQSYGQSIASMPT